MPSQMSLNVLLPYGVFAKVSGVARIVVETREGSYGLLPNRLDFVAAVKPGILTYQPAGESEVFVAVDEGAVVKTGPDVWVSVRNAIAGTDLSQLRKSVAERFMSLNELENSARLASDKMESGFMRRLAELQNE